jgi:uncharacterized protein
MKIWIDADNCSKRIMEIINRASVRVEVKAVFVADREIDIENSLFNEVVLVKKGKNAVDKKILENVEEGDIIITADIPFASEALLKGVVVINPRGDLYTTEIIRERLSMRNFLSNLRDIGINTDSNKKSDNIKNFSDVFDRELTKSMKLFGNK